MSNSSEIVEAIRSGKVVPYLGPGVLNGVVSKLDSSPIPADSDSLILAMSGGQPMAPRLMYEFPRAAMHIENKKGRSYLEKFLLGTYAKTQWSDSEFHHWLAELNAPYVIDVNRDLQLQNAMQDRAHTLIVGVARIAAHPYRFDIYENKDGVYQEISQEQVNASLPVLFKPLGSPNPKPNFIASDADFVDYITELMGGFAIPGWLKEYRMDKQYVFLGMRFTRDTERMVMSDIIYGADSETGWAFIENPTDKEKRFLDKKKIQLIEQDWSCLVKEQKSFAA